MNEEWEEAPDWLIEVHKKLLPQVKEWNAQLKLWVKIKLETGPVVDN